jgi:heat shock 70kDa protein 1/2/6/8
MNAENTIYDSKRLIGRKFDDPKIEDDLANWSFNVIRDADNNPQIQVKFNGQFKLFTPEQVSAMILENLKQSAERFLREPVTDAVITVPAYFSQEQREATKVAGTIAGLNVLQILNEPTAAALAYGLQQQQQVSCILIFLLSRLQSSE